MKADISYEYYFNTFNGGQDGILSPMEFPKYINRAARELQSYCGCVGYDGEFKETVMLCVCEIAETLFKTGKSENIQSETIDGYSVTFLDGGAVSDKISRIVRRRLGLTGLLYAGVE